jgi:hypothetical protein
MVCSAVIVDLQLVPYVLYDVHIGAVGRPRQHFEAIFREPMFGKARGVLFWIIILLEVDGSVVDVMIIQGTEEAPLY